MGLIVGDGCKVDCLLWLNVRISDLKRYHAKDMNNT